MAEERAPQPRQLELLRYLAGGYTYAQIGRRMGISCNSVRVKAHKLYGRLGVRNSAHAVAVGYQRGLLAVEVSDHG